MLVSLLLTPFALLKGAGVLIRQEVGISPCWGCSPVSDRRPGGQREAPKVTVLLVLCGTSSQSSRHFCRGVHPCS